MWKCKYCGEEFTFKRTTEKANHTRWCKSNPMFQEFKEKNSLRAKQTADSKFGKLKKFKVLCSTCSTQFEVQEREHLHPSKQRYFCSRKCSNSVGGTAKALKHHPDEKAHYKTVLRRHHKHQCIVCGFDKIIDAHHVDMDHNNNDPNNLVPLCPNHHRLVHSRWQEEVQPHIDQYIKSFMGP